MDKVQIKQILLKSVIAILYILILIALWVIGEEYVPLMSDNYIFENVVAGIYTFILMPIAAAILPFLLYKLIKGK